MNGIGIGSGTGLPAALPLVEWLSVDGHSLRGREPIHSAEVEDERITADKRGLHYHSVPRVR